jgi:hypothetical protein
MNTRVKDVVSGGVLLAVGLLVLQSALGDYRVGTFARMGPGLFPALVGGLLAGLGGLIAITALLRAPGGSAVSDETFERRAFVVVLLAITLFPFVLIRLGMLPAVVAVAVISVFAAPGARPLPTLMLVAALAVVVWVVFGVLLQLPIDFVRWHWR